VICWEHYRVVVDEEEVERGRSGVNGDEDVLASGLYEGDDEVRLDEIIFSPCSSATLLVPNDVNLCLEATNSGATPAS
jgi:hypothetical protein